MKVSNLLQYVVKKIKKEDYVIDPDVSPAYLFKLSIKKAIMIFRGKLSFVKNGGMLFIGSHVKLKAKGKITLGCGVTLDDYTYIDALSKEGILFGNNVSTGKRTVIECTGNLKFLGVGFKVGDNVGLGRDAYYGCAGGVQIGSDTIIGNYVSFHSENHIFADLDTPIRLQGVSHQGIIIGKNCWLGAKATFLDGAVVGDGCIISAGSVVTKGVYPSNGIYGGVPAKLLKMRPK